MKLKTAGLLAMVATMATCALAADTNLPPKLTFELRDGSRVIGTSIEDDFRFQSALLGNVKLAVKDIRSVDCTATNAAKLTTANGDTLAVSFADPDFKVKTSFGKIEITANSVRQITIASPPKTIDVHDGLVLFWAGNGDTQNNIGTDPTTTASLNAGPVMVKNNPALVSMQQTRQLTFEAWIKPDSIPFEFPVLLSKGGNQTPDDYGGYEFFLNSHADHDFSFDSGPCNFYTSGGWINDHLGEWIHVAGTIDDNAKTRTLYINAEPANDGFRPGSERNLNFDVPNNLYIGSPDPASHPNRARFVGEMRNVTLYNRVLTVDEIRKDFSAGHPE